MGQAIIYPETYAVTPPKGSDGPPETEVPLLQAILAVLNGGAASGGGGTVVVDGVAYSYDALVFDYYDNPGQTNVFHIYYRTGGSGGTTVATATFAYAGGNPAVTSNLSVQAIVWTH